MKEMKTVDKKKNSLLVVDDDHSNLMILTHILKPEYNLRVASKGTDALKIAEKYSPDLILLDILMPEMDGYQLFTALQNSDKTAKIPVIFITGLNNSSDEKKGLKMGAVDYINKPFDDVIVKLRVGNQIKIINQLHTIEHLSMIDQLTGLPNRRNFDSRLRLEWGRSVREQTDICILMLDVDRFKNYNDSYGHQQGDKALQTVALILNKSLNRNTDFCARWGGEEFVVLLPNTHTEGGMEVAEQIRAAIEEAEIPKNDGSITRLTVSIGVSAVVPAVASAVDDIISQADDALYTAKKTGRNKVCRKENP